MESITLKECRQLNFCAAEVWFNSYSKNFFLYFQFSILICTVCEYRVGFYFALGLRLEGGVGVLFYKFFFLFVCFSVSIDSDFTFLPSIVSRIALSCFSFIFL